MQDVAKAVAAADAAALAAGLRATGAASVELNGEQIALSPDEVIITETPREGWAVANEAGATVALDLHITPELKRLGVARDAIRQIQEARKNSGLDVADRIVLRWLAEDEETAAAITEHGALVAEEVLAVDFAAGAADWESESFSDDGLGLAFQLRKA